MERTDLEAALLAPFDPSEVKWKPGKVSGNRAMALAYVDARVVQDRLDAVFGVSGWQDEYTPIEKGAFICRLSVLIDGQWVSKSDVGGESEQPDGGDRAKAAVSDALKRAAVKFGVGRYLYRLPAQLVDFDPAKKGFAQTPKLPANALPEPVQSDDQKANREKALAILEPAAKESYAAFQLAWKTLSKNMRASITPQDSDRLRKECFDAPTPATAG